MIYFVSYSVNLIVKTFLKKQNILTTIKSTLTTYFNKQCVNFMKFNSEIATIFNQRHCFYYEMLFESRYQFIFKLF